MISDDLPRFAVLISGRGSNLKAILDADVGGTCVGVVSSRAGAAGLDIARHAGLPSAVISGGDHADRSSYDRALHEVLSGWEADWIVLAGFMRIVTDEFLARHAGRVVNVHPSLLPAFPGLHPHRQALAAGVKVSGCTVHMVQPGAVDSGTIVAQAVVDVHDDDTEESLAARILEEEHRIYPAALRALFEGSAG